MWFLLGVIVGVIGHMLYRQEIAVNGSGDHWVIEIRKEVNK